jgi:hypothetical protein
VKSRSTLLPLAVLATLSLAALAPTEASAWGRGGWDRFEGGGYRSLSFAKSYGSRTCEGFASRSYAPASQPQGFGPMRRAQSFGPAPQQGYVPPQRMQTRAPSSRDTYEGKPETDSPAPEPQSNPGNVAHAQTELQK